MKNLPNASGPAGVQTTLFSQEVFLANPTQWPEKDSAKKTTDTSGQKCLESYARFSRHGSWAKTFSGLLIGMEGWSSTRCKLTWKLKGTKYNRMFFQLAPSTLPTEETEFGLLPTPQVMDIRTDVRKPEERSDAANNGGCSNLREWAGNGLLPTPTVADTEGSPKRPETITQSQSGGWIRTADKTGTKFGAKLMDVVGLLPTPTLMDSSSNGDMSAAAKMMRGASHRASGQQIQKTLTMAIHQSVLMENPKLVEELSQKDIQKRENLPTQEEFVTWIRTVINAKDLSLKTGIQLTKVEHWFRKDKAGFSYPSIQEWNVIKPILNPTQEMDRMMTTMTSKQWRGMLPTPETPNQKSYQPQQINLHNLRLDTQQIKTTIPPPTKLLPTPVAGEYRDTGEKVKGNHYKQQNLTRTIANSSNQWAGDNSQLNPQFVAEMMGFPTNWTELPFQSGETKASKPTVTQSSHK